MAILSPVEKLIALRKKYKINQKDLAGDQISRSHLAMIETGKNKLNENTAKILIENFNKIFKERKISEIITFEELMESKEEQIEKLKLDFLQKLEKNQDIESVISDVESYASEYDVQTKITLYEKIGNIFFEKENLHRAASFYLRILNDLIIIRDLETLGKISLSLIRVYLQTENFNAAVDLENLIKSEIENFQQPEKTIILYNLGLIYDSIKDHKKAINYFWEVEKFVKDEEKIFDVKNYQALSLADLGKYSEAVSIYRSLMLKYKDPMNKLTINCNLLYISKLEKNKDKIKFYYRKCKHILKEKIEEISKYPFELEQSQYSIGEIAEILTRKKDAIEFYLSVCKEKTIRNNQIKYDSIKSLLRLFTKKDIAEVKEIENLYFLLLQREENFSVGYNFIDFYFKENLKKEQELFLEKIKQFIQKN